MPKQPRSETVRDAAKPPAALHKAFRFYLQHQDELVAQYDGKVVVIKDGEVLGTYNDDLAAVTETQKSHALGTFLVQKVSAGTAGYTQMFHSRVVFP